MRSPLRLNVHLHRDWRRNCGEHGMGNSLRDELLKAGLVSEKRPKKPRRSKRGAPEPAKKSKNSPARAGVEQTAPVSRHVLRENQRRTARFVRDATLGGATVAENAKKALRLKIEKLLESERLNDAQADIAYHFVKGKRIKRIYVTEDQRAKLGSGAIVVAALDGLHHLLTRPAAEQLLTLAPHTVVCGAAEGDADNDPSREDTGDGDEHPVPDDITW